jgi:arsenite-transporting ATPase
VVADTAPTGHTLRLLALPATFRALVALLDTMQDKHRFMVSALTHRYRADTADAFLAEMRQRVGALERALRDPANCAAVIVARPEGLVLDETERLATSLAELGIARAAVVANAAPAAGDAERADAMARLQAVAGDAPLLRVPDIGGLEMGLPAIERWSAAMERESGGEFVRVAAEGWRAADESDAHSPAGGGPPGGGAGDETMPLAPPGLRAENGSERPSQRGGTPAPSGSHPGDLLVRPLTIVGGKGGVGKTTIACALALAAAADRRVLLVSTDPAPSIADALAQPVGDAETPVAGFERLAARQMDAAKAFERLRTTYQARIDAVFDGLVSGGMDATHDRRVLRDLLALAPPGIDELYALGALGDTLEEGHFDVVVVDPAPTGHLLRLLEMPALALEWSHRLMRLMLKYKEVTGLGDAAAEVLAFARRTRRVGELLRDPARAGLVLATLDEPLVRDESRRLARAVAALGVPLSGVVWNRAADPVAPLGDGLAVPQFLAGAATPPPRGPRALLRWLDGWHPLPAP